MRFARPGIALAGLVGEGGFGWEVESDDRLDGNWFFKEVMKMFLTKYNPVSAFDSIWSAFDQDFFPVVRGCFDGSEDGFRLPSTNINEKENEFVLTMEIPGVSKKDVDVSLDGNSLIVSSEQVGKVESDGLIRSEISTRKFRRCFQLGSNVDREKIKARMENGILELTLPKRAESVGRKINIS